MIQSLCELIRSDIKTTSIIDDEITYNQHNVIRIIWEGYGICCDITKEKIIVLLPGPKTKEFDHEDWKLAVHMIKHDLNKMISYSREVNGFNDGNEEISEGG